MIWFSLGKPLLAGSLLVLNTPSIKSRLLPWNHRCGFELASGAATATAASDLDLLLQAPLPLPRELAHALYERLAGLPVRADLLLETPRGALALAEYVAGRAPFGLRTLTGPHLVHDPWRTAAAA